MPNVAKIYSDACGSVKEINQDSLIQSPTEQQLSKQTQIDWLQHQHTQDIFRKISIEIGESIDAAVKLAVAYPINQNHLQIIQFLNKAYELRKILEKYGKSS